MNDFESYSSPFSWRYASSEMRQLWSERTKRLYWRKIWVALAQTQAEFGLVTPAQVADLEANVERINLQRALELEAQIRHDLMAELRTYAEQCPVGGGVIHLGATSMDIEDNTEAIRLRDAMAILLERLRGLLKSLCDQVDRWVDFPIIAFTHLQPAEPSTLGYRLACYTQDLWLDWQELNLVHHQIRGKGFKGAVGTGASYAELFGEEHMAAFEAAMGDKLGIAFFVVATQTYPRKQDYRVISALAGLASSLYKFAFDLRILQSPPIGELAEPFGRHQVGSSAMPFKRNPIQSEKIDSLARALGQLPAVAWGNAAHSLLERTLDDSANRRTILPEAFLMADELLITTQSIIEGLRVNEKAIQRNLDTYGPFASTERLLMALGKAGANRQEMHEILREHAMASWEAVQQGNSNPLKSRLLNDNALTKYISPEVMAGLLEWNNYLGNAPIRAAALVKEIRSGLNLSQ